MQLKCKEKTKQNRFEQCMEKAVTDRMCQNWFAKFHAGDFSLDNTLRSGIPVEVGSNQIETLIENNQHFIIYEIAKLLKISKSMKLLVKMKNVSFILQKKTTTQTLWSTQYIFFNKLWHVILWFKTFWWFWISFRINPSCLSEPIKLLNPVPLYPLDFLSYLSSFHSSYWSYCFFCFCLCVFSLIIKYSKFIPTLMLLNLLFHLPRITLSWI